MRKLSFVCAVLVSAAGVVMAPAQMTIKAVNQNPAYGDTNIFFSFGGANSITGTINGQAIALGTNYTLAQINSNCSITAFSGGAKIFISLGSQLTSGSAGTQFARNFANPSLADYYTRWDKVELSYLTTDSSSVANLTADDFAALPLRLDNGTSDVTWHYHGSMAAVLAELAALCGNSPNSVAITNGQIVRVISPHTSSSSPWPSMQPYLDYTRTNAISTHVMGTYNGIGGSGPYAFQTYDLHAIVNSGGNLVLTGSCSVAGATTISVAAADFLPGVYSAAPPYTVNNVLTNNSNSVYDAAIRDILAAYNLGLAGTTKIDPRTSTAYSNETTQVWYNYPGNGTVSTSLQYTNVFGALWSPGIPFFNQYADILSTNTDAYSFPFNDTLAKPLLPLINNPTLTITILPDTLTNVTAEYFSRIVVTNGIVTLSLANLTPGTSNSIDRTSNLLVTNGWQNVTNFIASGTSTNYSEAVRSTNTFYRARYATP